MAPQERTPLVAASSTASDRNNSASRDQYNMSSTSKTPIWQQKRSWLAIGSLLAVGAVCVAWIKGKESSSSSYHHDFDAEVLNKATGPYQIVNVHEGQNFFDGFTFYEGADSLGSAGYLTYMDRKDSFDMNLANVTTEEQVTDPFHPSSSSSMTTRDFVYMSSKPTKEGPRDSVRLEGKTRYHRGLFVLDLRHLPTGCGVWPAFWLTDEDVWPDHGEIDIVEGINTQRQVKTALHTSDKCDMYAHVPGWAMTGSWDRSTGIPDTFSGKPDFKTSVPADNCWVMASHRWANQGCVISSDNNNTLGAPLNKQGGGVFVLEWDPANTYIRSWAFTPHTETPTNLQEAIATANTDHPVTPDPQEWPSPYAHFAIGKGMGCSADHFQNMRLVINLAFCGMVAGNRFLSDCPAIGKEFGPSVDFDPVWTCNKFIQSEPESLSEAYWKIGGVYVYQREVE